MRANRIALLSLIALVPLSVGVVAGLPLLDDATYRPQPTRTVPVGESATNAYGLTFTVEQTVDAQSGVPDDMSLIGILVTLDPGDLTPEEVDALLTPVTLTDEGPGGSGEREWELVDNAESLGWGYLEDTRRFMDLTDVTGPTQYELVFSAPPGTYQQATLRIGVSEPDFEDFGDGGGIDLGLIEPDLRFALDYGQKPT